MSLPRSSRPEAPAASVPAPTSSRSVSSSIPLKPDPSNTVPFSWSCKCTNVILKGRIHKDLEELVQRPKSSDSKPGGSLTSAWINSTGEHCKMHEYMIFEGPGEMRGRERMPSGETKGTWRRCLMCNVKVYQVPGLHTRDDHSTRGLWVEIDLNDAIYYGPSLDKLLQEPELPFSKLRFPVPTTSTNFRRMPGAHATQSFYPNPFVTQTVESLDLLPERRDVFMGAPRPPPPHPFLHRLCTEAERYTADRHHEIRAEMLDEINAIITQGWKRYLKIEEAVRSELEILHDTFLETNPEARDPSSSKRRGSVLGKAKSRSPSREAVQRKFSPPPKGHPSIQSVIGSSTTKLKHKGDWNQDPSDLPEGDDDDVIVPPTFATSLLTTSLLAQRQQAPAPSVEAPLRYPEQLVGQDLEELRTIAKTKDQRAVAMSHKFSVLDEQMANAPPKDGPDAIQRAQAGELPRKPVSKIQREETVGKILACIIPENQESSSSEEGEDEPRARDAADEGDVFDFEMHDEEAGPSMASSISFARTDEYAGHAPSHRNGWKDKGDGKVSWNENKDIYDTRTRNRNRRDVEDNDSKTVSKFGQSMPIPQARQPLGLIGGFVPADLEPKTSLSEREGYLVPPLKVAGKKTVRIESPVPEASVGSQETQSGITERKDFVPPHIQVREEEKASMRAAGGSRSIYDK